MATVQHYKHIAPPNPIKLLIITEAPPLPPENYFYNISANDYSHGSSRSFFRGIMQGFGLLSVGVSCYSERKLLDSFIARGYFVIDSCPVPLVDAKGEQLPSNKKMKIMAEYVDSLVQTIESLNPEKILFVCGTNKVVLDQLLKQKASIVSRIVSATPLPYPGVGWLRRPDKKGFMDLLPPEYKLSALY